MAHVRQFRSSDLDGLLAVQNASVLPGAGQGRATRDSLARHWQRTERDLWVTEVRGGIVAYGGLRPWHSAGWLQAELVVRPQWRGRGLGAMLLAQLTEMARLRGAFYLCAVAPDEPGEGGRFLLQHGFHVLVPRQHMRLQPIVLPEAPAVAGFRLRAAGEEDCAALATVNNAAYATGERGGRANAAGYRRFLRESGARVWVAEERSSGQVAGLCEVREAEAIIADSSVTTGHIGSLAVRPSHHRRGLGRWLLTRGISLCRETGWPSVELNVDRDNAPALRLYERAGFRPVYAFTVYRCSLIVASNGCDGP